MGNSQVRRDNFKGIYVDVDKRLAPNTISIRTGVDGTRETFKTEKLTNSLLSMRVELAQKKMTDRGAARGTLPHSIRMGVQAYNQFQGSGR